jgi:hypothetical protein
MNRHKAGAILTVLAFALFGLRETALAQSKCQEAKGDQSGAFDPTTNALTGTMTNAGWLNGPFTENFDAAVLPTPDPAAVTFTSTFTVTTVLGELRTRNVTVFNFITGNAAVLGHIDPVGSTGRFAGASGVLYFAGITTSFDPFLIGGTISGELCFPPGVAP